MLTRRRSFTVFLAIAAIAAANCIGPQTALAAHHGPENKVEHGVDHDSYGRTGHDHDRAAMHAAGQDTGTTNDENGVGGPSKFCCSTMTCTASAVLAMAAVAPMDPVVERANTIQLEDMLRAFNAAAIDPPPRIG
jgi:hypothetical protein